VRRISIIVFSLVLAFQCQGQLTTEDKINNLLPQLTLEEKISMIHATEHFSNGGIPRLGIPGLRMSDGPCGVREEMKAHGWGEANWNNDDGIYLPANTALASTWNVDLAKACGEALGQEAKIRGKHVHLAPGINIQRSPLNGRNWEYMSEDPYLIAQLVVPLIHGIQSNGVAACVKHYALNNQETDRFTINVEVEERALREIYLPGFEAAIKEGEVLSVMGAYDKVRGQHATYNKYLIMDILKGEWGFKGPVISDWGATHNTVEAGSYGLDIEMGGVSRSFDTMFMAKPMFEAIKKGWVNEKDIDDKVRRILFLICKINGLNEAPFDTTGMKVKLAIRERCLVAKRIAEEAIVLLKNDHHILPLDIAKIKSLAVIGDNAIRKHSLGGGSTAIKARYEVTPLEGLERKLYGSVKINFVPGYHSMVPGLNKIDSPLDTIDMKMIRDAVEIARSSDYVIIFGGLNHNNNVECEGSDRKNMKLPYGQDLLISEVVKANPKTIVVLLSGSPVELGDWFSKVPGLLQNSYLGMEAGNTLAEVLFGEVNPSGKLPYTFLRKLSDSPAHNWGEFPGKNGTVHYKEGIYVGYRYFDSRKVEPMFPFGYGLSYTKFEYSNLVTPHELKNNTEEFSVTFNLKNVGSYEGKEISQVYIREKESIVERPYKELKGFSKVLLKAGETKKVTIHLNKRAIQYYDPAKKQWVANPGKFEILVGGSSKDIQLKGETTFVNTTP